MPIAKFRLDAQAAAADAGLSSKVTTPSSNGTARKPSWVDFAALSLSWAMGEAKLGYARARSPSGAHIADVLANAVTLMHLTAGSLAVGSQHVTIMSRKRSNASSRSPIS
jgi:hypothetical protein